MSQYILDEVIRPVIDVLGGGEAAVQLVYWTGLAESHYNTREQYGGGPAMGYWQMEPATHDDIRDNYLSYRHELVDKLAQLANCRMICDYLTTYDTYACAMCRVHYLRVPEALPPEGDLEAHASYWKRYYNTHLGAGTIEHFIDAAKGGVL